MKDQNKAKTQLIDELVKLRHRNAELKKAEIEYKRAKEALRESEERFRSIFKNTLIGLYRTTPDGRIIIANPALVHMLGYSSFEELAQRNLEKEGFEPEYPRSFFKQNIESKGSIVGLESAWLKKDGTVLFIRESANAIRDDAGNIIYYEGTVEDITERKRAEEELILKESAIASSINAIALADLEGNLTYVNYAFLKMWGYDDVKEVLGKSIVKFWHMEEKAFKVLKALRDGKTWRGELVAMRKDGTTFYAQVLANIVSDEEEKPFYMMASFFDITDRKETEKELEAQKELTERIIQTSNAIIIGLDENHIIRLFNKGAENITGYKKDEVMDKDWFKTFLKPEQLREMNKVWKAAWGKTFHSHINSILIKGGKEKIISWQNTRISGKKVNPEIIICIGEDITEHKQIEEDLKRSEARYRDLVEKSGIAILIDDKEGNLKYFNKKFLDLFGYSEREIKKKSITKFTHPDDVDKVMDFHKKRIQGKKVPSRYEFKGIHKDGSTLHLELDVVTLKEKGEIIGTDSYIWDISERKRAEEALWENIERFREILENTEAGYFFIDQDGRYQDFNDAWLRMHKYTSPNEVIGQHFAMTQIVADIKKANKVVKRLLGGETIPTDEFTRRCKDGSIGYHTFSAHPIVHSGKVIGAEGFLIDTTDRKQAEEEKERFHAQLVQSEKMAGIGTLASGIAHEFNNLLQIMRGHTEIAQRTKKTEHMEEALDIVLDTSDKVAHIIKDLLTFSRPEEFKKELCDITEPIESVLSLTEEQLKKYNINVVRKYGKIPPIEMNKAEIQQVFLNMVTNARDAMSPEGGILEISVKKVGKDVKVSFTDTGKGIEEKNLNKVFEPFYTTKGALGGSRKFPGTGLGLSVSYGIVKRHGGKIKVESKVDKGTTFTVTFPLKRGEPKRKISEKKKKEKFKKIKYMNILAVDDEKEICTMLTKWLSEEGYGVKSALSGRKAINLVKKEYFNVIFLDIIMPGIPAAEVLEKIKEISPKTKIIVITGRLIKEDLWKELKQKGAFNYLQKPFKIEEVKKIIQKIR